MSTLARQLGLRIMSLVCMLALLGCACVWGLIGLMGSFDASTDQYEQLRAVYEIGHEVATARLMGQNPHPEASLIVDHLARATRLAQSLDASPHGQRAMSGRILRYLRIARGHVMARPDSPIGLIGLNEALNQVAFQAAAIKTQILANRRAASERLRITLGVMSGLASIAVLIAMAVGLVQYRAVIGPLGQLQRAMSRVTGGDLRARVPAQRLREFRELAQGFNGMARQLEGLYCGLEERIAQTSRQLVRSERLASVGYLAAGVAHEINNPLAIICGHVESALRTVGSSSADAKVGRSLQIICEEAFRCRDITSKLLGLARPSGSERERVNIGAVAQRVAGLVGELPRFGNRRLDVAVHHAQDLGVVASEPELMQVLLNVVCNALEAVEDGRGAVQVIAERDGDRVRVRVSDNGRGMTRQVLDKVFEPFFTDKCSRGESGLGLGLSIAHAIIGQHGGTLAAHSDGPGLGSTFWFELPAATPMAEITA